MSQLVPILLYGGEVWGPYLNPDFSSWEKTETEKTHTQFLKRILGCDIRTSNIMARSEVGRRPLLCQIVGNSLNFINHIRFNPESLAYQALVYEQGLNDNSNIFQLVKRFTPFHNIVDQHVETISKTKLKKQRYNYYDELWKTDLLKLSKSESYRLYKSNICIDKYLDCVKNSKHRKALTRLRLSCHSLMIEKGRYQKLERQDRLCPFCTTVIEDECHFITSCPTYENARANLYLECRNTSRFFDTMNNPQKFIFIMSNENPAILSKLGAFTFNCFKLREQKLGLC